MIVSQRFGPTSIEVSENGQDLVKMCQWNGSIITHCLYDLAGMEIGILYQFEEGPVDAFRKASERLSGKESPMIPEVLQLLKEVGETVECQRTASVFRRVVRQCEAVS